MGTSPNHLLHRAQGEYLEMPGLSLTLFQAQRLWALDAGTCEQILDTLVENGFLKRRADGAYIRTEDRGPWHRSVDAGPMDESEDAHATGRAR